MSDDDMPTADAVAAAVVAAARVTGESPLLIAKRRKGVHCRYPAMEALRVIYPATMWVALGRMVGIYQYPRQSLVNAKKARWYPTTGRAAFEAALEAMEAL